MIRRIRKNRSFLTLGLLGLLVSGCSTPEEFADCLLGPGAFSPFKIGFCLAGGRKARVDGTIEDDGYEFDDWTDMDDDELDDWIETDDDEFDDETEADDEEPEVFRRVSRVGLGEATVLPARS